ncbi:TlpA family protein disulfide reductase [Flavobacterium marginilacus]|uniref:TlpA family protein disulfide reductase n=1 Tax=Flavobacterium marginilacus TaxID=3003256 RepID=UPI00248E06B5|nr:TlpA family protein disulfide reductase [Flavobacterium marginilacus]
MKYLLYLIFPLLFSNVIVAQKVAVYDNYITLEKEILNDKSTTYVVNFWATWCAPCVKELPYFERLNSENKKVKVVLVSLDFKNQYETKLLPFVKNRKINSEVVLLTDRDYNAWLPIVSKDWSGSIPATLIIQNGVKKVFAERSFSSYEELNEFVNKNIN